MNVATAAYMKRFSKALALSTKRFRSLDTSSKQFLFAFLFMAAIPVTLVLLGQQAIFRGKADDIYGVIPGIFVSTSEKTEPITTIYAPTVDLCLYAPDSELVASANTLKDKIADDQENLINKLSNNIVDTDTKKMAETLFVQTEDGKIPMNRAIIQAGSGGRYNYLPAIEQKTSTESASLSKSFAKNFEEKVKTDLLGMFNFVAHADSLESCTAQYQQCARTATDDYTCREQMTACLRRGAPTQAPQAEGTPTIPAPTSMPSAGRVPTVVPQAEPTPTPQQSQPSAAQTRPICATTCMDGGYYLSPQNGCRPAQIAGRCGVPSVAAAPEDYYVPARNIETAAPTTAPTAAPTTNPTRVPSGCPGGAAPDESGLCPTAAPARPAATAAPSVNPTNTPPAQPRPTNQAAPTVQPTGRQTVPTRTPIAAPAATVPQQINPSVPSIQTVEVQPPDPSSSLQEELVAAAKDNTTVACTQYFEGITQKDTRIQRDVLTKLDQQKLILETDKQVQALKSQGIDAAVTADQGDGRYFGSTIRIKNADGSYTNEKYILDKELNRVIDVRRETYNADNTKKADAGEFIIKVGDPSCGGGNCTNNYIKWGNGAETTVNTREDGSVDIYTKPKCPDGTTCEPKAARFASAEEYKEIVQQKKQKCSQLGQSLIKSAYAQEDSDDPLDCETARAIAPNEALALKTGPTTEGDPIEGSSGNGTTTIDSVEGEEEATRFQAKLEETCGSLGLLAYKNACYSQDEIDADVATYPANDEVTPEPTEEPSDESSVTPTPEDEFSRLPLGNPGAYDEGCPEGTHEEDGDCVPDEPEPISCNEDEHEENGECVKNETNERDNDEEREDEESDREEEEVQQEEEYIESDNDEDTSEEDVESATIQKVLQANIDQNTTSTKAATRAFCDMPLNSKVKKIVLENIEGGGSPKAEITDPVAMYHYGRGGVRWNVAPLKNGEKSAQRTIKATYYVDDGVNGKLTEAPKTITTTVSLNEIPKDGVIGEGPQTTVGNSKLSVVVGKTCSETQSFTVRARNVTSGAITTLVDKVKGKDLNDFTIDKLEVGQDYEFIIYGKNYVSKKTGKLTMTENLKVDFGKLIPGDVYREGDSNTSITEKDMDLMVAEIAKNKNTRDLTYDLNCDGQVEVTDYGILANAGLVEGDKLEGDSPPSYGLLETITTTISNAVSAINPFDDKPKEPEKLEDSDLFTKPK